MIKAIIFDADGMIVHGERFSNRLAKEFGISTEVTGKFFKTKFQDCLIGKADLKDELKNYITEWKWKGSLDDMLGFWFLKEVNIIDERFIELITDLRNKGIKCYLATNNEKYRTDNLVDDRGLGAWFDGVFSSAYIGSKKPESEFFTKILSKIDIPNKAEVLFTDDDPENIEGAESFGLPVLHYTDFEDFKRKVNIS